MSDDIINIMSIWEKYTESVAYAGNQGFGHETITSKPESNSKNKVVVNNPVAPNSIADLSKVNVTDNFTDGKELRDLHDMRLELDQLEREFFGADALMDVSKKEKLGKQLEDLKKKIKDTTEKLTPVPTKDVA